MDFTNHISMRVVDALNTLLAEPDDAETRLDAVLADAVQCRAHLQLQLMQRPDISAELRRAGAVEQKLADLIARTRIVQESGQETLESVKNVTKEIKILDKAKDNLTSSVRMLRQLRMLSRLYSQLDSLLKERRYEDMAGTVQAASDLIEYFRPFRPLPQISKLSQEIGDMEVKIYEQIQEDFSRSLESSEDSLPNNALRAACEVLDSLDTAGGRSSSRKLLIEWYCTRALAEYKSVFAPSDEAGGLENVQHRFTYLKNRVIKQYINHDSKLFPQSWPVQSELVTRACDVTSDALVAQIPRLNSSEGGDMELLLSVLQESKDFEKYIQSPPLISSKIVRYLYMWVEFQERQLGMRINGYAQTMNPPEAGDEVLISSKELINFYRVLLSQLAKFSPSPELVNKVIDVLANNLGRYAQHVLMRYLPNAVRSNEELEVVGIVNATVDYIISTTHQLERSISAQYITESETKPETKPETKSGSANSTATVHVDDVFEHKALVKFRQVSVRAEDLLVNYASRNLEQHYIELGQQYSSAKGSNGEVSNVSPFTHQLAQDINALAENIFQATKTSSISYNVAGKLTESVCVQFLTTAMARVPKPVQEYLAEQMLLDFGAVKQESLFHIIEVIPKEGSTANLRTERLKKRVMDLVGQTEAVLKVLMGSAEPTETFVRNYQLLIKDRSTLNFRKVLDVKGIRFQSKAMEKFKVMASQDIQLAPESYLLTQIPTVAPQSNTSDSNLSSPTSFGMNNFKKIGEFLRRDY